jgi:hypothetical protein
LHPGSQIEVYGSLSSVKVQCFAGEKSMKSITQAGKLIGAAAVLAIPAAAQKKNQDEVEQVPTHVGFPPTTTTQTTTHGDAGAEVGPPDDLLFVSMVGADGGLNARLWQRTQKDGLNAPDLKLFQRFKDDVNKSAEAQTKRKAASGGGSPAGAPANPGPTAGTASAPNPNPAPNPPGANHR